jgi:ankyrin repeat protein
VPLHWAADKNSYDTAQALLLAEADPNAVDNVSNMIEILLKHTSYIVIYCMI